MNWEGLLNDNNIEYVTSGPNTKRGEVSVKCPWCGSEDPSQHLGISLSKEAWACYRNAEHRGKSPIRLIQALLGCTVPQARLTLAQYRVTDPDSLEGALAILTADDTPAVAEEPVEIKFPNEFRPHYAWPNRFYNYLYSRGFARPKAVASMFGLLCAGTGRYKDRIIFPLYLNELIGWTGRAIIDPVSAPRYLASSDKVKKTCYGYPEAKDGGSVLFIVEGPFDALRINAMDYKSVRAVALMGTDITVPQLCMIRSLIKKYTKTYIFLDNDAFAQSMRLSDILGTPVVAGWGKDPASLDAETLKALFNAARTR